MALDLESRDLQRKLRSLKTHVKRTEALAAFLKKNPALASDCAIKATMYGGQLSLYFEDRAYIHAVGSDPIQLVCSVTISRSVPGRMSTYARIFPRFPGKSSGRFYVRSKSIWVRQRNDRPFDGTLCRTE